MLPEGVEYWGITTKDHEGNKAQWRFNEKACSRTAGNIELH